VKTPERIWSPTGRPASVKPAGTLTPAMAAMFAPTVKRSERYIASGSSSRSPSRNAGVGLVGPMMQSHFSNAASKSCRTSRRTLRAFL